MIFVGWTVIYVYRWTGREGSGREGKLAAVGERKGRKSGAMSLCR